MHTMYIISVFCYYCTYFIPLYFYVNTAIFVIIIFVCYYSFLQKVFYSICVLHFCFTFMYTPQHQVKFLVRVNLPGDKPVSDSDSED